VGGHGHQLDLPPACGRRDALSVAHSSPHARWAASAGRERPAATNDVQRMIIAAHVLEA